MARPPRFGAPPFFLLNHTCSECVCSEFFVEFGVSIRVIAMIFLENFVHLSLKKLSLVIFHVIIP
jgi:hypothetical protein